MRLEELQRKFSESIRCLAEPAAQLPIRGNGIEIYRNNYRSQLCAVLKDSFPYLVLWLGDAVFERCAEAHIACSEPNSWTLDDYGRDFPNTLRSLFPNDPEVWELAWLELAMAQAFVAKDDGPVEADALNQIDWDSACINFVSSLRFSEAQSNAAEIWSAFEEQSVPPAAELLPEARAYVVWRRDFVPRVRVVPISEYQVITALRLRFTFAETCEILRLRMGEERAAATAGEMLGRWLSDGLVAAIEAFPVGGATV
jgi:hypothetical protein